MNAQKPLWKWSQFNSDKRVAWSTGILLLSAFILLFTGKITLRDAANVFKGYNETITFRVQGFLGNTQDIIIPDGCAMIIDKAVQERELDQKEIDKLISLVPREDASAVFHILKREWYESKGWSNPALTLQVLHDTEMFIEQYYPKEETGDDSESESSE